jgi:hypothetical protein
VTHDDVVDGDPVPQQAALEDMQKIDQEGPPVPGHGQAAALGLQRLDAPLVAEQRQLAIQALMRTKAAIW